MHPERQPNDAVINTPLSGQEIQDTNHQLVGDVHSLIAHQDQTYFAISSRHREQIEKRVADNQEKLGIVGEVGNDDFLAEIKRRDQELVEQRRPAYWFGSGTVPEGIDIQPIFKEYDSALEQMRDPRVILLKDIKRGPAIEKRISEHLISDTAV